MPTRRSFLKILLAASSGWYLSGLLPLTNETAKAIPLPRTPQLGTGSLVVNTLQSKPHQGKLNSPKPLFNALSHLSIPTYDHSDQSVHPSVIDLKTEYGVNSWGGFQYWMAHTPYPNFNSAFENPSLLASNDGINWSTPPGIVNPLASKPNGHFQDSYNSDPELVFDPDQNILILYWREYRGNVFEKIWAKKITSNYEQSDKFLCLEKVWDFKKTGLVLSPTVWRKNSKEWFMWTCDGRMTIELYTSPDGVTWSSSQPCSAPWETWNGGYVPWHVAVKPNYPEQTIEFLIVGWPKQQTINNCQLLYAIAPMTKPKELSMPLMSPLLEAGSKNHWDDGYIYRSSFVREHGNNPKFRVWYSACSKTKAWHIGYTEASLDTLLSKGVKSSDTI